MIPLMVFGSCGGATITRSRRRFLRRESRISSCGTSRKRHALPWRLLAAVALIYGVSLSAQTTPPLVVTDKVQIRIWPQCQIKPETPILVVLDGDEDNAFPAKWSSDLDVWTGYWRFRETHDTFDARGRKASLRLNKARSECRPSREPTKPPRGEWMATFEFACPEGLTRDVKIARDPAGLPISYVRRVHGTLEGSVDCVELGTYRAPIRDIL